MRRLLVSLLLFPSSSVAGEGADLGARLPLWSALPFVAMLLAIALFPLLRPSFWHHHYGKVAAACALLFAVPFTFAYRGEAARALLHIAIVDYVPFVILLTALFVVSGGIVLRGSLSGSPLTNLGMLAAGSVLASIIGTTGASMVLIRPLLRANAWRSSRAHIVVFFIFLVSNVGGSLTPIGDPPLFLGFLHGVPFGWTLRLLPHWAMVTAIQLAIFYAIDVRAAAREQAQPLAFEGRLRVEGGPNLALLVAALGVVIASGSVRLGALSLAGLHLPVENLLRDGLLIVIIAVSLRHTPRELHAANGFSFGPMHEVAILFAGIFATIVPVLLMLGAGAAGPFAGLVRFVDSDLRYFFVAGALSSVLDNAPTYLTFFNSALASLDPASLACLPDCAEAQRVAALLRDHPRTLEAISAGSVWMGANTYIGNAPNFMVKSIAEENGVTMPGFFAYSLRWVLPFLLPTLVLVGWVMFG
jgi:Na+/H+ antiporter NhaD/arsenite permease-like protein